MSAPQPTAADLLPGIQALMPRGPVWPRDSDSNQAATLLALLPTYERLYAAEAALLADAFPATTDELLPEWQATLGLPDPCAGPAPTLEASRAQVVARFAARGGQSVPYLEAFAAALGFSITITEFRPFCCGMPLGLPLCSDPWAYVWCINAVSGSNNDVLECELTRIGPGHELLMFNFS